MNIIYLGLLYSDTFLQTKSQYTNNGLQMATHNFQKNLLTGLKSKENINIALINVPPIGSFPLHCKKIFMPSEINDTFIQRGYVNIPVVKKIQQEKQIIQEVEELLMNVNIAETVLVAYSPYIPFLKAIRYLKRKHPKLQTSMIVTDCIPGREDMKKNMTRRAKIQGNRIVDLARFVDDFVLLTEYLSETLEIKGKQFVVVECICNEYQEKNKVNKVSKNRCLYTGTLEPEFGVFELANAFASIKNSELWICGDGKDRKRIEKVAEEYDNIKYFGFLSMDAVKQLRDECDFLINPRKPTGTYTKYSFPSKTAEYLMSGKPVIMYKLEGVPDEYDEYINYLSGNRECEIKNELEDIFYQNYEQLLDKSEKARNFMLNDKNSKKQAQKIIDMWEGF